MISMTEKRDTSKATQASAVSRRLKRFRRWADEMRAAGWTVEEPK